MKLLRSVFIITLIVLYSTPTLLMATTLSVGDVVLLAVNGDGDDGFSMMPLVNLDAGTQIFVTDIGWSDNASAFLTTTSIADKIVKYTAPTAISAGTIIRCDVNHQTNFTLVETRDADTTPYLYQISTLSSAEEVLVFTGSVESPTFLFAITDVFTGWGTNVPLTGTDASGHGSALPSGLINDETALSLASGASAIDNWAYTGEITDETKAVWQSRVENPSNWTGDDVNPTILTGSYVVTDASLPVELSSFSAKHEEHSIILNWTTESETDNLGFILERAEGNSTWRQIASYKTDSALKGHGNSSSTTNYTYTDNTIKAGAEYHYRLGDVNTAGTVTMHSPISVTMTTLPQSTVMLNAYPNPFNPETIINYNLHKDTQVTITVYDLLGRKVKTLIDEQQAAGSYHTLWNGTDASGNKAASGAYIVRMETADVIQIQKILLLK